MKFYICSFITAITLFLLGLTANAQSLLDYADFVAHYEGLSLESYEDNGFISVGYGHRVHEHMHISEQQAKKWLFEDICDAYINAKNIICDFDKKPDAIKLVIVSMVYNLGPTGFKSFKKAIKACNDDNYLLMSEELRESDWYKQVGLRSEEHAIMLEYVAMN